MNLKKNWELSEWEYSRNLVTSHVKHAQTREWNIVCLAEISSLEGNVTTVCHPMDDMKLVE